MSYYVVVDTNVLISAMIKENSVPYKVIDLVFNGKIIPLMHEKILAEYERVANRTKFKFLDYVIEFFINGMKDNGKFIDAKDFDEVLPDPNDKIFYCVLMTTREDVEAYLVTGNLKHFPIKPFIVTPRELLDIIENEEK